MTSCTVAAVANRYRRRIPRVLLRFFCRSLPSNVYRCYCSDGFAAETDEMPKTETQTGNPAYTSVGHNLYFRAPQLILSLLLTIRPPSRQSDPETLFASMNDVSFACRPILHISIHSPVSWSSFGFYLSLQRRRKCFRAVWFVNASSRMVHPKPVFGMLAGSVRTNVFFRIHVA